MKRLQRVEELAALRAANVVTGAGHYCEFACLATNLCELAFSEGPFCGRFRLIIDSGRKLSFSAIRDSS
jgi:hypothetical protein